MTLSMNRSPRLSRPAAALPSLPQPARMLLATLVVAVAAGMAQTAFAQPAGGMHGMRGGMHGEMGGAMAGAHVGRMLDLVGATADQRAQIKTIMDAARSDLQAQRGAGRALREQMQSLMAQPTIDARAVEGVRQQLLAQHDTASKRMLQATVDAANVLTPVQRKTLADKMAQRQAMMAKHAAERAALEKGTK